MFHIWYANQLNIGSVHYTMLYLGYMLPRYGFSLHGIGVRCTSVCMCVYMCVRVCLCVGVRVRESCVCSSSSSSKLIYSQKSNFQKIVRM